ALHAAECALGPRQRRVDPPRLLGREVLAVGAEQVAAVETRRDPAPRFVGLAGELSRLRIEAQGVVARHPRIALLEPPDRLADLDLLLEPAPLDPRPDLGQVLQEAPLLLGADGAVLLHALLADAEDQQLVLGGMGLDPHRGLLLARIAGRRRPDHLLEPLDRLELSQPAIALPRPG